MAAVRHFGWHLGEMFLAMLVGMAALDLVRGHNAGVVSEMGIAMVVVGATTVFLLWLSGFDAAAICAVECGLMIPAMVAAMLLPPGLRARRSLR